MDWRALASVSLLASLLYKPPVKLHVEDTGSQFNQVPSVRSYVNDHHRRRDTPAPRYVNLDNAPVSTLTSPRCILPACSRFAFSLASFSLTAS